MIANDGLKLAYNTTKAMLVFYIGYIQDKTKTLYVMVAF
jgi:hypothetical protein